MTRLTEELADWVHGLRYEDLPGAVVDATKREILGILGAAYAGLRMETSAGLHDAVRAFGDRPESTVIGGAHRERSSMRTAAMANSFLAQILEWEDWVLLSHAGASVVPTAFAVAEARGASGKDLVTAIAAGNEVVGRSGEVMQDGTNLGNAVPNHQLEVPLVAGKLLGLDPTRLADAIGVACTQPQVSSLIAWPAPAKGMLTGWPVQVGVTAAQLAEAGVIGSHDVLDNPLGFVGRTSDVPSPERLELLTEGLGDEWRTETLIVKPYPADGFAMTAIAAAIQVHERLAEDDLAPSDVDEVTAFINVPYAATSTLFSEGKTEIYDKIGSRRDWTYIALQYDGAYPVARALVDGRFGWEQWADEKVLDPDIRGLVEKVTLVPDLVVDVWGAEVHVRTSDGRTITSDRLTCIEKVDAAEKFRAGADGLLTDGKITRIVEDVGSLEGLERVRDLTTHF